MAFFIHVRFQTSTQRKTLCPHKIDVAAFYIVLHGKHSEVSPFKGRGFHVRTPMNDAEIMRERI